MIQNAQSRAQDEAAVDALIQANAAGNTGEAAAPSTPDTGSDDGYVGQPGTPTGQTQGQQAPVASSEPPPVTPPASPNPSQQASGGDSPPNTPGGADDGVPEESWKQKFMTVKGKFDAEVPRLHQQLSQANDQVTRMQLQIVDLRQQLQIAQAQPAPMAQTPAPPTSGGSPETSESSALAAFREEYGDDMANAVQAIVRSETANAIPSPPPVQQPNLPPVQPQEQLPPQQTQAPPTAQQQPQPAQQQPGQDGGLSPMDHKMISTLAPRGIDYVAINSSPEFLRWLDRYDESGSPYKLIEQAQFAFDQGDTARLAEFFVRYNQERSQGIGTVPNSQSPDNPLRQHAQVPDGGAGQELPPSTVSLDQAYADYVDALDKVARGLMTEEDMQNGPEKVYYSVQAQVNAQQAAAGATPT